MYGPVPLYAAEEDRQALWVRLVVLPALEEVTLNLVVYTAQGVAVQILLKLCQVLILDLHVDQVLLVPRVLRIRGQLIVLNAFLISRAVV